MALDLKSIRAIQRSLNSPSDSETRRRDAARRVKRDYFKSLDPDKFLYFDTRLTDRECFLTVATRKYSHYNGIELEFTCPIDTCIEAGDIVYNPIQDEYWVVIKSNPVDYIYRSGLMFLCDAKIKWQDKYGNVWEYPVVVNNTTQYNSGIYQGKYEDHVTSQYKLTTTADINTCALKIDTRFFLGKGTAVPEVYKLTQNDTSSLGYGKGIAMITVLRSTYNPETDDIETRLCLMKEPVDGDPPAPTGSPEIIYSGDPRIVIGGTKSVRVNTSAQCDWAIAEAELIPLINIKVTGDNSALITIPISKDIISYEGRPFTLVCNDGSGNTSTQSLMILGGA